MTTQKGIDKKYHYITNNETRTFGLDTTVRRKERN